MGTTSTPRTIQRLPIAWGDDEDNDEIRESVSAITTALDTDAKTRAIPRSTSGTTTADYITYEWQTRRYPVNADVQGETWRVTLPYRLSVGRNHDPGRR